jgi:hypothetical protein
LWHDNVGCSDSREIVMGMTWTTRGISGWAHRSQQQSVANAREATTALSRRRVEREEVELFLRSRTGVPAPVGVRRPA